MMIYLCWALVGSSLGLLGSVFFIFVATLSLGVQDVATRRRRGC